MERSKRRSEFVYEQLLRKCYDMKACKRGDARNVFISGCQYKIYIGQWNLPRELGMGLVALESIPKGKAVFEYVGTLRARKGPVMVIV